MNIKDLISYSGDSYLESYFYESSSAFLVLNIEEIEMKITLTVFSNYMFFNIPKDTSLPFRTCYLELVKLEDILSVKNGIYVPSEDFGKFMKEKRQNLNLAYGSKSKEYSYLFSISSGHKLASFLVRTIEDIDISPMG